MLWIKNETFCASDKNISSVTTTATAFRECAALAAGEIGCDLDRHHVTDVMHLITMHLSISVWRGVT